MYELLWQKFARRWFARRWYRALIGLVAPGVIAIPLMGMLLASLPHTDDPLRVTILTGLVGGISVSLVHCAIAITVVMRSPTALRTSMLISIPALVTVFAWYLPMQNSVRVPLIFAIFYSCVGAMMISAAFRLVCRRELVGPGGYGLGTSRASAVVVPLIVMAIFLWAQDESHYTTWLSKILAEDGLFWCVAAGAATTWSLLALSFYKSRRLAYLIGLPIVVIAMLGVGHRIHEWMFLPVSWGVLTMVMLAATAGWCLTQELATRYLSSCHWKWRRAEYIGDISPMGNLWRSFGALCFLSILFSLLVSVADSFTRYPTEYYWCSFLGCLGLACAISFCVLAAHQIRRLWVLCLTLTSFSLMLMSMVPETMDTRNEGFHIAFLVVPTLIASAIYVMVRLADQRARYTIGMISQQRVPISIQELMGGTLILGIGFAMLRLADISSAIVIAMTGSFLFVASTSMVFYRAYFVGITQDILIMGGLLLAIILFYLTRSADDFDAFVPALFLLYLICHLIIARTLHRFGWMKIPI